MKNEKQVAILQNLNITSQPMALAVGGTRYNPAHEFIRGNIRGNIRGIWDGI